MAHGFLCGPVFAGPGHDHGDGGHGAEAAAASADVPRIESAGTDMELVATADGHKLTIYLDRIDTNEPVDGATIEVSGEGIPAALATRVTPGTYELAADWVDMPGTKALLFTVTAGGNADLLNGTLNVPESPPRRRCPSPLPWLSCWQRTTYCRDTWLARLGVLHRRCTATATAWNSSEPTETTIAADNRLPTKRNH